MREKGREGEREREGERARKKISREIEGGRERFLMGTAGSDVPSVRLQT